MKKFEIINSKWIKKSYEELRINNSTKFVYLNSAIKISSISQIQAYSAEVSGRYISYFIALETESGIAWKIEYGESEENEFKNDLLFFENLLFQHKELM